VTDAALSALLTDDELLLLVSWGEVTRGHPDVLHDWEDEDDELLAKIEEARPE
jgi:hypothetical protein